MEISEAELRSLVDDVDEEHRAGMHEMSEAVHELHHGEGARLMAPARRSFIKRAGLTGAAVTVGGSVLSMTQLVGTAGAQGLDDGAIAAFAESVELAAVEAYKAAAASGKVTTQAVADAATTFASHHMEHAGAFGGAAGDKASGAPNMTLLNEVGPQLEAAADEMAIIELALGLEEAAAATYLFALGALTSKAALELTASILPVESQHAVVLATVLGKGPDVYLPSFETQKAALDPTKYPIK